MKRFSIWLMGALLLACASSVFADSYLMTDMGGAPLGRLPYIKRGDESLVPLALLARKAGWEVKTEDAIYRVIGGGRDIKLRRGNPFAGLNDLYIQMRLSPEEWDGSLWVALSCLGDLFGDNIQRDKMTGALRIQAAPQEGDPSLIPGMTPEGGGSQAKPAWSLRNVIIDAGHGGKDPGAKGLYGLEEKTLTLDIAKRLQSALTSKGIRCALTRSEDEFKELHERTEFANQQQGDLFVSIHCNSFKDPNIRGMETYFLKPAKSERAVEAALRENSVVELERDASKYQELTEENYILLTMATAQYIKDSESWAASALGLMREKTGVEARQVDQAGFYVLMGASMPAILVECGYLSNPDDAKFLASERGRMKIAEGLAESIAKVKMSLESAASR